MLSQDISTSKRKLSALVSPTITASDANMVLTSQESILELVRELHSGCGVLSIMKVGLNQGVYIPWLIKCSGCDYELRLNWSSSNREGKRLNLATVFGVISSGFDKTNTNNFLESIGLTHLPDSFYDVYIKGISDAVSEVVQEELKANREEVLRLQSTP